MKNSQNKLPVIKKGVAGYWHAYGDGWAVCAPTKSAVLEKYREMQNLISELISRPISDNILKS